jgi:hypothetical protein
LFSDCEVYKSYENLVELLLHRYFFFPGLHGWALAYFCLVTYILHFHSFFFIEFLVQLPAIVNPGELTSSCTQPLVGKGRGPPVYGKPNLKNMPTKTENRRKEQDSRRRQSNIVGSELVPKPGIRNVDLFLDICESHLTGKPCVVCAKFQRLEWQQSGKTKQLIIFLTNAESPGDLLVAAKRFRRSDDEAVRSKVYLTRDEAQAAYERRQRRRQHQHQQYSTAASAPVVPNGNNDYSAVGTQNEQSCCRR